MAAASLVCTPELALMLRERRRIGGWLLRDVADAAGLHRKTVSRLERGDGSRAAVFACLFALMCLETGARL